MFAGLVLIIFILVIFFGDENRIFSVKYIYNI